MWKSGWSFKYIIPSIVVLILIGAIILKEFIPKQLLGNAYNISELGDNFDNVQIGDAIEYSNNGVDRWVVAQKNGSSLRLIPESPIELGIIIIMYRMLKSK